MPKRPGTELPDYGESFFLADIFQILIYLQKY